MRKRELPVNKCGYVAIRETKTWKNDKILPGQLGNPVQMTGRVTCRQVNNVYQVVGKQGNDIIDDKGVYYAYVGKQYAGQKATVDYDIPDKARLIRINDCGYLVIKETKTYSNAKIVKVNGQAINPTSYTVRFGKMSCSSGSIGVFQGQSFAAYGSLYLYFGASLRGVQIEVQYDP